MWHPRWFLAAFGLSALALVAVSPTALAQQRSITVNLTQENASGITGSVTLTDMGGGRTRVDVRITPTTGDHPAHIHMGTCANLNPTPEFPLNNVRNGTSTTEVDTALATIQSEQRAVNLHLSAQEAATYVACGNIAIAGAAARAGGFDPLMVSGALGALGAVSLGAGMLRRRLRV